MASFDLGDSTETGILAAPATSQKPNMTPDYEVKLLLKPNMVLNSDYELTSTMLSDFGMPTTTTDMNIQFLDTGSKELFNSGWSTRIRKFKDENDFELTYKKRYPIIGGDIDDALTTANNEGFDAGDRKYDAQVEWGYQRQTLSISRKKSASASGVSGTDLPGEADSRVMLIDEAPDKFVNFVSPGWGTGVLDKSRIFGPILAKRSVVTWADKKLYIEVWPIKNAEKTGLEYIVEASFKTKSFAMASSGHQNLVAYLQGKGWLLPQESDRTKLILERYSGI
ncbi:uncharacterized protein DNG_10315 [Cephalotrichum gorgonifer]|uniref:Uncharacterized protein n=1 Tax=Cephalotrichum gorgonifer TaxID=2041049 RepID=A0AAE8T061_9PEZI|nr:uncharacterized protein DNG_10315 [Cephalotrichum gorgonifer]